MCGQLPGNEGPDRVWQHVTMICVGRCCPLIVAALSLSITAADPAV